MKHPGTEIERFKIRFVVLGNEWKEIIPLTGFNCPVPYKTQSILNRGVVLHENGFGSRFLCYQIVIKHSTKL